MNLRRLFCTLTILNCLGLSVMVHVDAQSTVAPAAVMPLPEPKTPQEFFDRARQLSDLEASGIPFHLKATYVASGNAEFTGNGTYEEWWQSKDLWRKEATLGDYKFVEIKSGDKDTVYGSSQYIPLRLRQMLEAVLIRITPRSGSSPDWKLKHQQVSGVDLEELSVERPCGAMVKCPAGDYFTPQGLLRIHVGDSVQKLYNDFEEFHGVSIPHSIEMAGLAGEILTISIASVEPLTPSEGELLRDATPQAKLPPTQIPILPDRDKLAGVHVTAAKLLNQSQPVYPPYAKQYGIQGTVVMEATIDQDGKIRDPYVVGSAGPMLDVAAMDAIRKWRYRPTTLNGVPVCVVTTITVGFKM